MKKLYSLLLTLLLLSSCRTPQVVVMPESHSRDSVRIAIDHRHDSIYIDRTHTLIQRGDTVFKTDSVYVEKRVEVEVHDTVTSTIRDSVPVPVEVPIEVEKPIPRVYRYSMWFTIFIIIFLILYVFLRIYFRKQGTIFANIYKILR